MYFSLAPGKAHTRVLTDCLGFCKCRVIDERIRQVTRVSRRKQDTANAVTIQLQSMMTDYDVTNVICQSNFQLACNSLHWQSP